MLIKNKIVLLKRIKNLATTIFTVFVFFNLSVSKAQNFNKDSLIKALKNSKNDTTKCKLLITLVESSENDSLLKIYLNYLLELSKNNLNKNPFGTNKIFYLKCYAYALSSNTYNNVNNNQNALLNYITCLKMQSKANDKKGMANTYIYLGQFYINQGNLTKALESFVYGHKITREINDKKILASSMSSLADFYYAQGNTNKSLNYYYESLKICNAINDKKQVALILANMALIYENQGNITKSLDYNNKSLNINEQLGNKKSTANVLNNLGHLYSEQGDTLKALTYYTKSLKIRQEIHDKAGIANSFNNVGYIYDLKGKYNLALDYYKKSLVLNEELGDKSKIATALNNIGGIYYIRDDFSTTLLYYKRSLEIQKEIGNKKGIALAYCNIGCVKFKQKEYIAAEDYFITSKSIAKQAGLASQILFSSKMLYRLYKTLDKQKLALENFELQMKMEDSIHNIENRTSVIKQQTQYEYDKKKILSDKEHEAQIEHQKLITIANKTKQTIIIASISVVLFFVLLFSFFLYKRFKITNQQKQIIEKKEKETQLQKLIIEKKHKEITDSLNYAERLQKGFLTTIDFFNENFKHVFILFKPKDKVSGDFYWSEKLADGSLAVCIGDSTGHGIPGAFMSLLNISLLNEAVHSRKLVKTNEILNFVRKILILGIKPNEKGEGGNDGMDCVLFSVNQSTLELKFSGANNNLWIARGSEIIILNGDKMPVGRSIKSNNTFTEQIFQLQKGDWLYSSTDGYSDQFGGEKGKKFMSKNLRELIVANINLPSHEQKQILEKKFTNWVGDLEQIDDVTILGFRV